jgi:ABC-type antimicrobial peptide transport system permease subunit
VEARDTKAERLPPLTFVNGGDRDIAEPSPRSDKLFCAHAKAQVAFGVVAPFLAAIGVYGVLASQVIERRREIGIRMALGSSASDVLRLVMRDGARMTLLGIVAGLAGTAGMARLMAGLLYGVRPTDPVVVGGVALLLETVALVATWLPARRAARVNPAAVLNE